MQLYQAVNGLGLADEVPKDMTVIDSVLKANKIVSIDLQEANGNYYLNELRLEGGIIVHLTSGARGARVLKITKEVSRELGNPR